MIILNKIKKYQNYLFIIFFLFIFINSLNLKLSYIDKIYTEYDDVGVISLYKGSIGDKEIKILDYSFNLKEKTIDKLNNNFFYPLYIATGWTYAPGQYLLVPFLNLEEKKFNEKLISVRLISSIASILNSLLIFYICINFFGISKWLSLLIFSIFSLSFNSNIYSNHMSPYSIYSLCSTLGVFICFQALRTKKYFKYYSLNSILIYFSYTNILFYLAFIFIELRKKRLKKTLLKLIKNEKKYLLINLLLLTPIILLILFKLIVIKAGDRGVAIENDTNFFDAIKFVIYQLNLSINSFQSGFVPIYFEKINIYFIFGIFLIGFLYSYKRIDFKNKIIIEILFLYFLIWIVFFIFKKLPLDQTRHSLIFFSIYLFGLGIVLKEIKYINIISLLLIILLTIPAIKKNHELLNSKKSNFNFSLISETNIKNIYSFSDTLAPFLFYEEGYEVYNLELQSYRDNFKKNVLHDELLLVSQNQSLKERSSYDLFFKNFVNLYEVTVLKELYSNTYMPYNNYKDHSTENGFYLYKLKIKD